MRTSPPPTCCSSAPSSGCGSRSTAAGTGPSSRPTAVRRGARPRSAPARPRPGARPRTVAASGSSTTSRRCGTDARDAGEDRRRSCRVVRSSASTVPAAGRTARPCSSATTRRRRRDQLLPEGPSPVRQAEDRGAGPERPRDGRSCRRAARGINRVGLVDARDPPACRRPCSWRSTERRASRCSGQYTVPMTRAARLRVEGRRGARPPRDLHLADRKAQYDAGMRGGGAVQRRERADGPASSRCAARSRPAPSRRSPVRCTSSSRRSTRRSTRCASASSRPPRAEPITGEERLREHTDNLYGAILSWDGPAGGIPGRAHRRARGRPRGHRRSSRAARHRAAGGQQGAGGRRPQRSSRRRPRSRWRRRVAAAGGRRRFGRRRSRARRSLPTSRIVLH